MDSNYTKQTLENGLTLITVPMPAVKSVTVLVMVKVGSRNEEQKTRGISHFIEHMVFKGTKKYPTHLDLSSTIDAIGAEMNAFTGKECTGFYVKSAAKHLDLGLDILSQLIFKPLIDSQEIKKEKGVIIEEFNMINDHPMSKISYDFETLLYGNTSLGWETIGTKKTVVKMRRNNFLDYMGKWYRPENMVVGIAGATPKASRLRRGFGGQASVRRQASRYFEKDVGAHHDAPELRAIRESPLQFPQDKPALKSRFKKTEQTHFCLGVRAFKRGHKDRYILAVLATILGGNMSSRLFIEVREKRGLAYYVKTTPQAYLDNGYLVTQAGTDIGKAGEAMRVILEEYEKVASSQQPVASKELKRAKEFLKGRLILGLEDSKEVASLFSEDWLMERQIRTPDKILKEIDKVTLEDVRRVAKEIFTPKGINLAIIGPYKERDRQKFEKIIK